MSAWKPALLAAATLALLAPASAQERVVNVLNWSDYIDESILQDFEAETGIKVVYDTFDSNETLETRLLAGGTGYDVVVPTADFLMRQIEAGVFQKLDKSKLPNLVHMWDLISTHTATYDPGNEYSINYMWGTNGIGYNQRMVEDILGTDTIDSWSVLFDPKIIAKFADCGVHLLDAPSDVIHAVLTHLGLDPNAHDADSLARVEEVLTAIRPHVRKFHSSEYINALANGDICLALGYSGDILQAANRAAEADQGVVVRYAIPKEGTQMWFDQLAIPADAPHVEEAHEFLNYLMRPEVIAKASNFVFYANGNLASQEFLDEAMISDPAIYPDEETASKLFTVVPYDQRTQRTVTRMWTRVLSGR